MAGFEQYHIIELPLQLVKFHFGQVTNRFFIRHDHSPKSDEVFDLDLFQAQFKALELMRELRAFALALQQMLLDDQVRWNSLQGSESEWEEIEAKSVALQFYDFLRRNDNSVEKLLLKGLSVKVINSNYDSWARTEAKNLDLALYNLVE